MYPQPRIRVKRNIHKSPTRPDFIFHHVGSDFPIKESFHTWDRVMALGDICTLVRIKQDVHAVHSRHYRTWGQA